MTMSALIVEKHCNSKYEKNIGIVMLMLASGVVDHVFEPWTGQTKDYKIGIGCFSASALY
jgi:hypothetical protein